MYLLTQITAAGYLWAASLGYGYPELFSIPGESRREIFHSLVMQKLPDMLVLCLLYLPASLKKHEGCDYTHYCRRKNRRLEAGR